MISGVVLASFLLSPAGQCWAAIFKCKGPDGRIVFSDRKCSGSDKLLEAIDARGSEAFFDGTNESTARASFARMLKDLPRDQAKDFKFAMVVFWAEAQGLVDQGMDKQRIDRDLRARLHGRTAAEIIEMGHAIERSIRERINADARR